MGEPRRLSAGLVLSGPTSRVRVVVLTSNRDLFTIACDGETLRPGRPQPCSLRPATGSGAGLVTGALYRDRATGVELRCVAAGGGVLTVDGRRMEQVPTR